MQSTGARAGLLVILAAVAVVLFIVLSNDDGDDDGGSSTETQVATTSTQETPEATVIAVKNGEPVGGVADVEVSKGDQVTLEVQLDRPEEEIHVHGYDIEKPAEKSPVRIAFKADIEGIFEVEVHGEGGTAQIAELTVNP